MLRWPTPPAPTEAALRAAVDRYDSDLAWLGRARTPCDLDFLVPVEACKPRDPGECLGKHWAQERQVGGPPFAGAAFDFYILNTLRIQSIILCACSCRMHP